MADVKGTAQGFVDRAKGAVGRGGPPLAHEVGGRVAAVREAFQAFGEGDVDRFLSAFADDVEWIAPKGDNFPGAGTHHGRDAVKKEFADTVGRSYASFGFRPRHYLPTEDEELVVIVGAYQGEPIAGKGNLDVSAVQVWEFSGERVTRVRIYADSADFPRTVDEQEDREQREEAEAQEKGSEERAEGNGDRRSDEGKDGEPEGRGGKEGKGQDESESEERGSAEGRHDGEHQGKDAERHEHADGGNDDADRNDRPEAGRGDEPRQERSDREPGGPTSAAEQPDEPATGGAHGTRGSGFEPHT